MFALLKLQPNELFAVGNCFIVTDYTSGSIKFSGQNFKRPLADDKGRVRCVCVCVSVLNCESYIYFLHSVMHKSP